MSKGGTLYFYHQVYLCFIISILIGTFTCQGERRAQGWVGMLDILPSVNDEIPIPSKVQRVHPKNNHNLEETYIKVLRPIKLAMEINHISYIKIPSTCTLTLQNYNIPIGKGRFPVSFLSGHKLWHNYEFFKILYFFL